MHKSACCVFVSWTMWHSNRDRHGFFRFATRLCVSDVPFQCHWGQNFVRDCDPNGIQSPYVTQNSAPTMCFRKYFAIRGGSAKFVFTHILVVLPFSVPMGVKNLHAKSTSEGNCNPTDHRAMFKFIRNNVTCLHLLQILVAIQHTTKFAARTADFFVEFRSFVLVTWPVHPQL